MCTQMHTPQKGPFPSPLQGYDWGDLYPFVHRTLPALRYTAENYFLLDLNPNGTFRQALQCAPSVGKAAAEHSA